MARRRKDSSSTPPSAPPATPNGNERPIRVRQISDIQGNPLVAGQRRVVARVATEADLTRDYVASNIISLLPALQSLPHAFDDLACDFGPEIYEQMANDPEVAASLGVLVLATCASEARLVPGVQPDHPDYGLAEQIAAFHRQYLDRLDIDEWRMALTEGALRDGSSVAEIDYGIQSGGDYDGYLVATAIKPKLLRETSFVIDAYQNVIGLIATRLPNLVLPVGSYIPIHWQGDSLLGPNEQVIRGLIPRSKFVVFTWRKRAGDPRGRSALRPAYPPYWIKQKTANEGVDWIARYIQPSIWGVTAQNAIAKCITNPDGSETIIEPTDQLLAALSQFRNASVMALPFGSAINTIAVPEGAQVIFQVVMDWADREITRAILLQHLATGEGQHQARASSEVHQDVLSLLIIFVKTWQARQIRRDLLVPLTIANYGQQNAHLAPRLDLGDGDGFPITPAEVAALQTAGWFTEEQMPVVDRQLGLPVRR